MGPRGHRGGECGVPAHFLRPRFLNGPSARASTPCVSTLRVTITEADRAILTLRTQRRKMEEHRRRVEALMERETTVARTLVAKQQRPAALLALKKKRLHETQLEGLDNCLLTLEETVGGPKRISMTVEKAVMLIQGCRRVFLHKFHSCRCIRGTRPLPLPSPFNSPVSLALQLTQVESAQRTARLMAALKQGADVLSALQRAMPLESVEQLMEQGAESREYEMRLQALLGESLGEDQSAAAERELDEMEAQLIEEDVLDLPKVPSHAVARPASARAIGQAASERQLEPEIAA